MGGRKRLSDSGEGGDCEGGEGGEGEGVTKIFRAFSILWLGRLAQRQQE